ncbi:MAG: hypothetical protein EVA58_04890 [Kiritimatiellaceae bacterium]|nr:MAG: hypothetical protein EVA58_04890 [Kiritimatiellaceae bacterium]|tara:strand:- start:435 stop:779 length:345 start_codon:yes stop_codon:yes gene_type:complete
MKIKFRGWKREVYPHNHVACPVELKKSLFSQGKSGEPIKWASASKAFAKIDSLSLTGDFLLEMEFSADELRSWLSQYVQEKPEAAIRLLSEMKSEAIINLTQKIQSELDVESDE